MAFTFVQDAAVSGASFANPRTDFGATPTNGNLIVAVLTHTSKNVADITPPVGYTTRVAENDGSGCLFIVDKIAASEGTEVRFAASTGANWDIYIAEFSGVAASGYFDSPATFTNYGSVDVAQPGSKTPANSTELMVATARHVNTSAGEAADSSFTVRQAATLTRLVVAYKIKTTAAAENPSLSWSSASDALAAMVAYSPTPIGGGDTARPDRHLPRGVARGATRGVS